MTKRRSHGEGTLDARGENSFRLRYRVNGKRFTKAFHGSASDARKELRRLIRSGETGEHVDPSKITVAKHTSARIAQWEAAQEISAKTAERYRELLTNQIEPHIGDKLIQKLTTTDVESWHTTLRSHGRKDGSGGLSNRTIGHAHRVLSKALSDGARHDLVTKNVAAQQGAPAGGNEEMVILTDERVREMLTALKGRAVYPRAITLLFTGLRRGELLAGRWRHADIDAGKVLAVREALEETKAHGVRFKKPKTKNGIRDLSLPDIVVDALREYRKAQLELRMALGAGRLPDDALIFPALDGGPQSPRAFSAEWADVAASIGMSDITLQALRHTHASQLIDAGIDVVTISKRLGHANPGITLRIYAHLFRKRDDKAADAINAALAGFGQS
jgi:integrase